MQLWTQLSDVLESDSALSKELKEELRRIKKNVSAKERLSVL